MPCAGWLFGLVPNAVMQKSAIDGGGIGVERGGKSRKSRRRKGDGDGACPVMFLCDGVSRERGA